MDDHMKDFEKSLIYQFQLLVTRNLLLMMYNILSQHILTLGQEHQVLKVPKIDPFYLVDSFKKSI
jgi:hypothetical protein